MRSPLRYPFLIACEFHCLEMLTTNENDVRCVNDCMKNLATSIFQNRLSMKALFLFPYFNNVN